MIKFIFIIMFGITCNNCLSAADSTHINNYGLNYSLSGLLNQINQGITQRIGLQFNFNKNSAIYTAIRICTGFEYSESTTSKPINTEKDLTFDSLEILINPAFLYYLNSGTNIKPYLGFGFLYKIINSNLNGIEFKSLERNINKRQIGGNILFGTEWFPVYNFSIGAEFEFLITYSGGETKYKFAGNEQINKIPDETKIMLKPSSLGLYLTYYFE